MTSFQVYLLMQADSISAIFQAATFLLVVALVFVVIFGAVEAADLAGWEIERKKGDYLKVEAIRRFRNRLFVWLIPVALIAGALPSTQTIAAMIVLPKITSPAALNAMGTKGQQLYDLTLKALNNLATPEKKS